jgi:hypothetical protein
LNKNGFNKVIHKAEHYVKENWGSPFIIGFMALLFSAAFSLSTGLSSLADTMAVYAFCALAIGVFLQLVCFLKYPHREEAEVI